MFLVVNNCIIISQKFENFGDIMFLVAPPSPPPPHANACTGHNFVTNTPIKFIFAIAIEVPDYKNPMMFVINRKNKIKVTYCSEMARNAIKIHFRHPKWGGGGHHNGQPVNHSGIYTI